MKKRTRILVAMSGGVDSSMAALLLHQQGYEIIGITMKTWDYASSGGNKKETGCCSLDSIADARQVAVALGFPHYVLDLREEFGDKIINDFVEEYLAGRTPNPCVRCNTYIKWEALWKRAQQLNCEYIATGHYARIRFENNRYILSKGLDSTKDQSYVLWGLSQEYLCKTIFPLANFTKEQVRTLAAEHGFSALARKKDSYEICFIPDNDYRTFLKRRIPPLADKIKNGNFVLTDGTIVGKHEGYPFYTIGQRKGLKVAMGKPMFVTAINPHTNTVTLGTWQEATFTRMRVTQLHLIKYEQLSHPLACTVSVRYKDIGTPCKVIQRDAQSAEVFFDTPVFAVTPGQSAVFYENEDVVGGGIIESAEKE